MNHTFKWHRRKISSQEYAEKMGVPKEANEHKKKNKEFEILIEGENKKYKVSVGKDFIETLTDSSKNTNAYKIASDIRKFEIDKYWTRTLYFWGFITAIYVAYFHVLKEFCSNGDFPLLIFSALGLFFCFSWYLASRGSKHWQENWENHIDMLEDDITGPLYKTYKAGISYSVSNINIAAGMVLSLCAYGLLLFETINFVKKTLKLNNTLAIGISVIFMLAVAVSLFVYSQAVKGNSRTSGSIDFDLKEYGNENEKSR